MSTQFKNKILSIISLGAIFQWLTLFFSYRSLPGAIEDLDKPIATGGFPLKIFEYPVHPMGNDWPPPDSWPIFFLNLAIWMTIAFIISFFFQKKLENKKVATVLGTLAIFLSLFGIAYLVLLFD